MPAKKARKTEQPATAAPKKRAKLQTPSAEVTGGAGAAAAGAHSKAPTEKHAPAGKAPRKAAPAPKKPRSAYVHFKALLPGSPSAAEAKAAWNEVADKNLPFEFRTWDSTLGKRVAQENHALYPRYQLRLKAEEAERNEAQMIKHELRAWAEKQIDQLSAELVHAMGSATIDNFDDLETAVLVAEKTISTMALRDAIQAERRDEIPLTAANGKLLEIKTTVAADAAEAVRFKLQLAIEGNELRPLLEALQAAQELDSRFEGILKHSNDSAFAVARAAAESVVVRLQAEQDDSSLAQKLAGMRPDELLAHAATFREANERLEMLETEVEDLRAYRADKEAEATRERATVAATAASLPNTIGKALQRQITYTGPRLKYSSTSISYTCGGVTPEIFAAAFPGSTGKSTYVDGETLGIRGKSLRYGAMLSLNGGVSIKLSGEQLTASASYSMMTGGGFGSGFGVGFRW